MDYQSERIEELNEEVLELIELQEETERKLHAVEERYMIALYGTGELIYEYDYQMDELKLFGNLSADEDEIENEISSLSNSSFYKRNSKVITFSDCGQTVFATNQLVNSEDLAKLRYFLDGSLLGPIEIRAKYETWSDFRWIAVEGHILRDSGGNFLRLLGKIRDITQEKKREKEILERVERDPVTNFLTWDVGIQLLTQIIDRERGMKDASFVYIRLNNMLDLMKRLGAVFKDAIFSKLAIEIRDLTTEDDRKIRIGDTSIVVFFQTATEPQIQKFRREIRDAIDDIQTGSVAGARIKSTVKVFKSLQELLDFVPKDERYEKSQRGEQDILGDIAAYAYNLIGRSNNITNAMDMLLERIAMQLRIDYIHILKRDIDTSLEQMTCLYAFTAVSRPYELKVDDKVTISKEGYQDLTDRLSTSNAFLLDSSFYKDFMEDTRKRLNEFNTSILVCPIRSEGTIRGCAIFEVDNPRYVWSESLQDMLIELSNIIGNYLLREIANEASMAKSNFLSAMSHEIRTPMNAIAGFSELILAEEGISDSTRLYAGNIRTSTNNLLSIINQILDISKIEAGKFEIIEDRYSVSSLLYDVCAVIGVQVAERPIEFIVNRHDGIPEGLIGDENRIRQIFINIINNSVKYTERGSITLDVSWKDTGEDKGVLLVSVSDTGIGIKEEDIGKLFAAYSQVDTKRNKGITGTGLGLSVCKNFLRLMHGDIDVKSKYGEGSVFSFNIPQGVSDPSPCNFEYGRMGDQVQEKFALPFLAPSARLMVVDDNQVNLEVAKGLMGQYKAEVVTASSGAMCLSIFEKDPDFDVIFMDQMMPMMDGIETAMKIRRLEVRNADTIPIVALTANAIKGVEKEFYAAGMNDYITKPIELKRLASVLEKWIPDKKKEAYEASEEAKDKGTQVDFSILIGIDSGIGLENCLMNTDSYMDLLSIFATGGEMEKADALLEKRDIENYKITVHAMKSSARYIGALELSDKAKELEDFSKEGRIEEITKEHPALRSLYDPVRESIIELLDKYREGESEDSEEKLSASTDELKEKLSALRSAIHDMEQDFAEELLSDLEKYDLGSAAAAALFKEIRDDYENFDFDPAEEKCESLMDLLTV